MRLVERNKIKQPIALRCSLDARDVYLNEEIEIVKVKIFILKFGNTSSDYSSFHLNIIKTGTMGSEQCT